MNNIAELVNIITSLGGTASFAMICEEYQKKNRMVLSPNHKITLARTLKENPNVVFFEEDSSLWVINKHNDKTHTESRQLINHSNAQEWILSANPLVFDHTSCFKENGCIDWRQIYNYKVGDIVFVYSSKTVRKITAVAIVERIDLNRSEIQDQSKYWKSSDEANKDIKKYFRLRLIKLVDGERLSYEILKQHGLVNAPQVACKINPQLSKYIHEVIGDDSF
ncbi:MAG: hypothetical protein ACI32B_01595 [Erysipelotrichaceae bacterium]